MRKLAPRFLSAVPQETWTKGPGVVLMQTERPQTARRHPATGKRAIAVAFARCLRSQQQLRARRSPQHDPTETVWN